MSGGRTGQDWTRARHKGERQLQDDVPQKDPSWETRVKRVHWGPFLHGKQIAGPQYKYLTVKRILFVNHILPNIRYRLS